MANGTGNGRSKWVLGALGTIAVFIGLLVTYGRTHGSESAAVQRNTEDIAEIRSVIMDMAEKVAVTATNVEWLVEFRQENDE